MIAHADVCAVINTPTGFALRAGDDGVQLRIMNATWSLPAGVEGSVLISVGDWKTTLDIDDNTNNMVSAEMSNDETTQLFTAMDKATSMSVAVGKAKPFTVSLSGSTKATNAVLTSQKKTRRVRFQEHPAGRVHGKYAVPECTGGFAIAQVTAEHYPFAEVLPNGSLPDCPGAQSLPGGGDTTERQNAPPADVEHRRRSNLALEAASSESRDHRPEMNPTPGQDWRG